MGFCWAAATPLNVSNARVEATTELKRRGRLDMNFVPPTHVMMLL